MWIEGTVFVRTYEWLRKEWRRKTGTDLIKFPNWIVFWHRVPIRSPVWISVVIGSLIKQWMTRDVRRASSARYEVFDCFSFSFHVTGVYQQQAMAPVNLNSNDTMMSNAIVNDRTSAITVILLIICLSAPSFGCTVFLLLHFGRIHRR